VTGFIDEDIREIADKRDWSDETLFQFAHDFIYNEGIMGSFIEFLAERAQLESFHDRLKEMKASGNR